ncbi:MAG: hypothetical protein VW270_25895, partial [Candidatus Poseidoniales archaeon]
YLDPIFPKIDDFDLAGIQKEWEMFTGLIREGKAERLFDGKRNFDYLPKSSETNYLHMRPCGRDGTVTEPDLLGNTCTKLALWLNASFVHRLILGE